MKNGTLYLLVGALTAGNLTLRVLHGAPEPTPIFTSHLEVGARIGSPELEALLGHPPVTPGSCHLVIAFNAECPHCGKAAREEKTLNRPGAYGAPLWISEAITPGSATFEHGLSERSRAVVEPQAFASLEVNAVPAAYLISADGTLRWVGPYRGSETTEQLEARCGEGTVMVAAEQE